MKKISILLAHTKPFWKNALASIFFNILSVVFGLFSLTMIVPFLQILFKPETAVNIPKTLPEFAMNKDAILDTFYFYMNKILDILKKTVVVLMTIIIVMSIIEFFDIPIATLWIGNRENLESINRVKLTFDNSNYYGCFCCMLLPFAFEDRKSVV